MTVIHFQIMIDVFEGKSSSKTDGGECEVINCGGSLMIYELHLLLSMAMFILLQQATTDETNEAEISKDYRPLFTMNFHVPIRKRITYF